METLTCLEVVALLNSSFNPKVELSLFGGGSRKRKDSRVTQIALTEMRSINVIGSVCNSKPLSCSRDEATRTRISQDVKQDSIMESSLLGEE